MLHSLVLTHSCIQMEWDHLHQPSMLHCMDIWFCSSKDQCKKFNSRTKHFYFSKISEIKKIWTEVFILAGCWLDDIVTSIYISFIIDIGGGLEWVRLTNIHTCTLLLHRSELQQNILGLKVVYFSGAYLVMLVRSTWVTTESRRGTIGTQWPDSRIYWCT